jgi:BspA type Leucine rich repeat region (6 copies)
MKTARHSNKLAIFATLLALALPRSGWAQFSCTTNNGAITITRYTGSDVYVNIPSTLNGYPVTTIGDFAFENTALFGVTIPDSVTSIGEYAFYYCYTLPSVTIPASVTNIGAEAFAACPNLWNIAVDAANPSYAGVGGVLYNKTFTALIQFPEGNLAGSYTISNSVTRIWPYAFWSCYRLSSVTMGVSLTNIGDSAFKYCTGLTAVALPDCLVSIGNQAFYGCSGLTNLTLGNSVTSIGDEAFSGCSGLKRVTMGDRVTGIGDSAFAYCSHLTSVTIPDSVIVIGDLAFLFCNGLTNLLVGRNVAAIGDAAFQNCTSLHQAYFQGNAPRVNGGAGSTNSTVFSGESGTVYFLPGAPGWGATFGGWPTAQWYQPRPQILGAGSGLSARSNGFQFTVSWATNTAVVVEASINLLNWTPVVTNTLVHGTNAFGDSTWTNYPQRFYRVRSK